MDCTGCIFAEAGDDGVQVGCRSLRLQKYIKLNLAYRDEESNFYELSKLCNMKRDEDWLITKCHPKYEQFDALDIAKMEMEPTFGIIIYDDSPDLSDINTTINSIKDINYNKNKYTVVWSIYRASLKDRGASLADAVACVQDLKVAGYKIWLSLHQDALSIAARDKECFSKVTHVSHWVKMAHGACIPKDTFNDINNSINDKLETTVLFENREQTISIIPSSVARMKYLDYNDYGLMVHGIRGEAKKNNLYTMLHETQ